MSIITQLLESPNVSDILRPTGSQLEGNQTGAGDDPGVARLERHLDPRVEDGVDGRLGQEHVEQERISLARRGSSQARK